MLRVLLIRPPFVLPKSARLANHGTPPLGVAYLAGTLKREGHQVTCIDAFGEKPQCFRSFGYDDLLINGLDKYEIAQRVPEDVDLIAVSCMFSNEWIYSREVIREVHKRFPNVPVIAGGEHITADTEQAFKDCPELSLVALGEGENTIIEIADALDNGKSLYGIPGTAYVDEFGQLQRGADRGRIREISELAWPSWEEMPLEAYLSRGLGYGCQGKRSMPMMASRGCPYECTFCSNPSMWTRRWVARDVEDVIAELKFYIERYQIEHFDFYDLTAIIRKDWTLEFCRRLIEEDLGLTWALPSGTRSEALTPEVLQALRASGCLKINYAPESGSETTLKRIKKSAKLEKMVPSMRASVKAGMLTRAHILTGLPDQTKYEVWENFKFAAKLAFIGVHDIGSFAFVPYPGSELFRRLVKEGKIKRDDEYLSFLSMNVGNNPNVQSWSQHISDRQMPYLLYGLVMWFYALQFLFRPWRVAVLAYRIAKRRPMTTIEIILSEIIVDTFTGRRSGKNQSIEQSTTIEASTAPESGRATVHS
ncbi:MAG: B12-binding domain-containing radical SAM protein [Planctomycetes bacterium]|nr:B12-binding domain-containing radical SAM protein [Planctomycetota bacterium]